MFVSTHLITGLVIGQLTNNYPAAIAGAIFLDIDHTLPYMKHKVFFNIKKFKQAITKTSDEFGDQRNYLHSIFAWAILSLIVYFINNSAGIAFSLGYLSHLILDAIDDSDFFPFYPIKKINLKGPIIYFSLKEHSMSAFLLIVFFLL